MRSIGRIVNTSFWEDPKIVNNFSPEDKYFYLYLLTNPHTTQLGIYSLVPKIAAFELGYSIDAVKVLIERFQDRYKIIRWSPETNEVAIKNYLRHSIVKGGRPVYDCLVKEQRGVKDVRLLEYIYNYLSNIDDLNVTIKEFIEYLSTVINTNINTTNNNDNDNERIVHDSCHDSLVADPGGNSGTSKRPSNVDAVLTAWNEMAKSNGMSTVRMLPPDSERYRLLRTRIAQYGLDAVLEAIANVGASDYLPGQRWFDFGWFVKPNNFPKVLEGKYGKAPVSTGYPEGYDLGE